MWEKILDFMHKHPVVTGVIVIAGALIILFIIRLLILSLEKSWNTWNRVNNISDLLTIVSLPTIAGALFTINRTLKKK